MYVYMYICIPTLFYDSGFVFHIVCFTVYGPLVRHWTMRYEAKHNHLKKLAQNIGNFINIAWTLSTHHQYWQCYKWQEGDLMDDEPEIGPGIYMCMCIMLCCVSVFVQCTYLHAT